MITKITNAVVVGDMLIRDADIYFEDGKILALTGEELPFDIEYDANGCYVSAGWIDIHTHGGGGYDFMDGGKECIVNAAKAHLLHGTCSIYPTTLCSSKEKLKNIIYDIKEAMSFPTIMGAHLEGPYFNPECCGAQNTDYIRSFDLNEINDLLQSGIIKRWDYAPEIEGSKEITKLLKSNNVVCAMGHSNATYEELIDSFNYGCTHATHLYSAMSTVIRIGGFRHLGIVEASFLLDDMSVEVIADGFHLPPELLKMIYKIKGADRICLVTDSMRAASMPDGEYILGSYDEGVKCIREDGVAKLLDRTAFAGSVATADRLVKVMYKLAGVSLCDTIKMITKTPAKLMGLATKGEILPGYDADLVVFDDDITIKKVILKGENVVSEGTLCL